jgi:hypothetical protein
MCWGKGGGGETTSLVGVLKCIKIYVYTKIEMNNLCNCSYPQGAACTEGEQRDQPLMKHRKLKLTGKQLATLIHEDYSSRI